MPIGRGDQVRFLSPKECEAVCHFLYDVSCYGFLVRTVEGPFFRRIVSWREQQDLRRANLPGGFISDL